MEKIDLVSLTWENHPTGKRTVDQLLGSAQKTESRGPSGREKIELEPAYASSFALGARVNEKMMSSIFVFQNSKGREREIILLFTRVPRTNPEA
jgi:hypothetical protein